MLLLLLTTKLFLSLAYFFSLYLLCPLSLLLLFVYDVTYLVRRRCAYLCIDTYRFSRSPNPLLLFPWHLALATGRP